MRRVKKIATAGVCGFAAAAMISAAQAQSGFGTAGASSAGAPISTLPALGQSSPFQGSISTTQVQPGEIALTLLDALDRGLKYNLGLFETQSGTEAARASRLRALSVFLPAINARAGFTEEQINLAALGFPVGNPLLKGFPTVVGPFGIYDIRGLVSGPTLSFAALNNLRASTESVSASQLNYKNARDLVVVAVGIGYLQALAASSRVDAVKAEFQTAQTLFRLATDQRNAGVTPAIDVLRSQVEMQAQQQRLVAAQNDFDKSKLALARVIGMPVAQQYTLAQEIPYSAVPPLTLEVAIDRALRDRPDYAAAQSVVRAAQLQVHAAKDERLPTFQVSGDYGVLGLKGGLAHGTMTATAGMQVPIFSGERIRSDVEEAQVALKQRQAEAEDLKGRIEFEVRSAFLDIKAASDQVDVARSTLDLAQQTLTQAQDRFKAGVTNNIEVVQAQEAVVSSNDAFISSMLQYNLAKLSLAKSLGVAERATKEFLGGKP